MLFSAAEGCWKQQKKIFITLDYFSIKKTGKWCITKNLKWWNFFDLGHSYNSKSSPERWEVRFSPTARKFRSCRGGQWKFTLILRYWNLTTLTSYRHDSLWNRNMPCRDNLIFKYIIVIEHQGREIIGGIYLYFSLFFFLNFLIFPLIFYVHMSEFWQTKETEISNGVVLHAAQIKKELLGEAIYIYILRRQSLRCKIFKECHYI